MTRFNWWLQKEWREHRAFLLLVALAIPLGSWLMVHVTRGQPIPVTEGAAPFANHTPELPPAHTWRREQWEGMLLVGLGVAIAGIAGGLFASERRRGMAALIARTPGAWRTAFVGKLAFLLLALAAVFLWHAAVLGRLGAAYELRDGGSTALDVAFLWPERLTWYWVAALAVLASWVVLASAVIPLVGVPVLAGAVACVGLAVPCLIWGGDHPYFFRVWVGGIGGPLAVWGLLGLGVAALVWFRWDRVSRSALRSSLWATVVLLLVGGAATGAVASAVSDYRHFDAAVPDLRLATPIVGIGERLLYVEAFRGDPDDDGQGSAVWPPRYGTRLRSWVIDLATGTWHPEGPEGRAWAVPSPTLVPMRMLAPAVLVFMQSGESDLLSGTWFDARTGERLAGGDRDTLPPGADERLGAAERERSGVRDALGRRAWYVDGRVEREGAEPLTLAAGTPRPSYVHEIPGGWAWYGEYTAGPKPIVFRSDGPHSLDAATGQLRTLGLDFAHGTYFGPIGWLDPSHGLLARSGPSSPSSLGVLDVVEIDQGTRRPLARQPAEAGRLYPLVRLGGGQVLVGRGPLGDVHVARAALDGSDVADLPWEGASLERVDLVQPLSGSQILRPWGALDERIVLGLRRTPSFRQGLPVGALPVPSPFASLGDDGEEAWAAYIPETGALRVLRTWTTFGRDQLLRALPDGALIVLESARRIVRLGPAAGERTVLFPR